ncbi:hypothetical protein [Enterovibrio sp. 27052020O]|uniref:hypothetical protein n=1 Tax=Enterovibrio sp. 27052020O TaxID=3241166 RepID=UPI00388F77D6
MDWLGLPRPIDGKPKTPLKALFRTNDDIELLLIKSKIDLDQQGCHYLRTGE